MMQRTRQLMKFFHNLLAQQLGLAQQDELQHQRELIYVIENLGGELAARYGLG